MPLNSNDNFSLLNKSRKGSSEFTHWPFIRVFCMIIRSETDQQREGDNQF